MIESDGAREGWAAYKKKLMERLLEHCVQSVCLYALPKFPQVSEPRTKTWWLLATIVHDFIYYWETKRNAVFSIYRIKG